MRRDNRNAVHRKLRSGCGSTPVSKQRRAISKLCVQRAGRDDCIIDDLTVKGLDRCNKYSGQQDRLLVGNPRSDFQLPRSSDSERLEKDQYQDMSWYRQSNTSLGIAYTTRPIGWGSIALEAPLERANVGKVIHDEVVPLRRRVL